MARGRKIGSTSSISIPFAQLQEALKGNPNLPVKVTKAWAKSAQELGINLGLEVEDEDEAEVSDAVAQEKRATVVVD